MNRQLALALFLLLSVVSSGQAQSALDGFDPNANGPVRAMAIQPDGKILIGGEFTALSPNGGSSVARHYMARLNPDGTVDPTFDPNPTGPVYAIALQSDGKIFVGGAFGGPNGIGGQPRNSIARLDPATGMADSFDPNANSTVVTVVVQPDGKILVGGLFDNIGGQSRRHIARLDLATGLADSFDPNANVLVRSIVVQTNGKILAGGHFTEIGGQVRNHIARLDPVTGLADSFDPKASDVVSAIALQVDGKILVGGWFSGANSIGGQTRNYMARIDAVTGLADSLDPNVNNSVSAIAVQPDGKILVGGSFSGANSIGGQTRNRIARLDPATGLVDSFDPNANDAVESIAVQADGKIVAIGYFNGASSVGGQTRNRIVRLETGGRLDQTLNLTFTSNQPVGVVASATQPDGKILIGGTFASVTGVPRKGIARLNQDGTLDLTFNPIADNGYPDPYVGSIVIQSDGKILVGGAFTSIGGQARKSIARIDAVTGLADSFSPNADGGFILQQVSTIVSQADGKLLVGGSFQSIGGQSRSNIARLDPATGLADSFNPNADKAVYTIAIQTDGKILVGGSFTNIGGQGRIRIARLDSVTGLADSFEPNTVSSEVDSIVVDGNGRILVGGSFMSIGGQTRWSIARLDPTTALADSFVANANAPIYSIAEQANGSILVAGVFTSISGQGRNHFARLDPLLGLADPFDPNASSGTFASVQPDGKVLGGGYFTAIGGQARACLARLTNDTPALQDLIVIQSAVVWKLSGSSPNCIRVAFDISSDNENYVHLGNGTRTGNDWVLGGLNLPSGTNFYIRARGSYRSGTQNASESIMESVRNVFLTGLTPTPIIVPPVPEVTPPPTKCGHCVGPRR